jgi:sterol desaturase/sphingolipid hydroxylase (fatty acid hydroxylase superfamily)
MQRRSQIARWLPGILVLGTFAALVVLERQRPLRQSIEPRQRHDLRNLAVAATSATALRLAEKPLVDLIANAVEQRRWGLLQRCRLPPTAEPAAALVLLDYTLFLWHVLLHRVSILWRCHLPHHVDLDLTASTALRFHFTELLLSVPWRAAQMILIGVRRRTLTLWQTATLVEILFHHSNLRLPCKLERVLQWLIVTPRLHGIHHSAVRDQTDSNWSSGLTLWDRLHRTLRHDILQHAIRIGVPAYRDPDELTLPRVLEMPFGNPRLAWCAEEESKGSVQPSGTRGNFPIQERGGWCGSGGTACG